MLLTLWLHTTLALSANGWPPATAAATCPSPTVLMVTPPPWSPQDQAAYVRARDVGCRKWVGVNTCLVKFIRVQPGQYRAICRRRG